MSRGICFKCKMKIVIIIALLIAQANAASFFEAFAPVEDSLGRLVTDVVSDLKDTIDCTILAVEHVFSIDGLFRDNSGYDERCRGQTATTEPQASDTSPDSIPDVTTEQSEQKPKKRHAKNELVEEIQESVSSASKKIQNIIDNSDAHIKIENVKKSLKDESDRLSNISVLLRHVLERIPEDTKKRFNFIDYKDDEDPTIEEIINEVKTLYKIEQIDKSSAEANEVRRVFDKVLIILDGIDIDGFFSDEDEVKLILKDLGKSSNESLVDVEQQVKIWTHEQAQEIKDIKSVVINATNVTEEKLKEAGVDETIQLHTQDLINEKLDEIEREEEKMVDFSHSIKGIAQNILNKVSEENITLPDDGTKTTKETSTATIKLKVPLPVSLGPRNSINNNDNIQSNPNFINEKLDKIEKEEVEMADFSKSIKNIAEVILNKVNENNMAHVDVSTKQITKSEPFSVSLEIPTVSTNSSTSAESLSEESLVDTQEKSQSSDVNYSKNTTALLLNDSVVKYVKSSKKFEETSSTATESPDTPTTISSTTNKLTSTPPSATPSIITITSPLATSSIPITTKTYSTLSITPTPKTKNISVIEATNNIKISHVRDTSINIVTSTHTNSSTVMVQHTSYLGNTQASSEKYNTVSSNIGTSPSSYQATLSNPHLPQLVPQPLQSNYVEFSSPSQQVDPRQQYTDDASQSEPAQENDETKTLEELKKRAQQLLDKATAAQESTNNADEYNSDYPDDNQEDMEQLKSALINKLFGSNSQDETARKEAEQKTKSFVDDNKKANDVVRNYFSNIDSTDSSDAGSSVFDLEDLDF